MLTIAGTSKTTGLCIRRRKHCVNVDIVLVTGQSLGTVHSKITYLATNRLHLPKLHCLFSYMLDVTLNSPMTLHMHGY